jgi:DUF4097 and DUF4098 domain-containing protein YvlB
MKERERCNMDPNAFDDVPPSQPAPDEMLEQQAAPDLPPSPEAPPAPDLPPHPEAPPAPDAPPRAGLHLGRIAGDLRIQPWSNGHGNGNAPSARLMGDHGAYDLWPGDAAINVDDDATLLVAGAVDLAIDRVEGDLIVAALDGALDVATVNGDATLNAISGPVALHAVQGDATAVNLADDLTFVTVQGDVAVDHIGGTTRVDTVQGDIILRHTGHADLAMVRGDLRAQEIASLAVARSVHGDVTIDQLNQATIRQIKGDLTAVNIGALLQVTEVAGDARLRRCAGQVRIAEVAGDIAAQDLAGGIIAECDGDAYLESRLAAGMTYQITAQNIVLRARSPISAQFVAQSTGGEIRTHLPLTVERHKQTLAGVIGQGEATVTLMSSGGDIILDAASTESTGKDHAERDRSDKDHFRVHVSHGPNGPTVDINGVPGLNFSGWPFSGGFTMSDDPNAPRDFEEMEVRLHDLGERSGRAARKAAEKFREYADRASRRARETDWEAVSRDVRGAIERTVGELEATFREIMAEFDANPPTAGSGPAQTKSGATAQRIPIDPDPVDGTATVVETTSDRDARRRTILEQVRNGELTLEQAEEQLRNL